MNILRKALQRGLTPSNIISYVCLESMRLWGAFWGTVRLRCKAALLGVAWGRARVPTGRGPVALAGRQHPHRRARQSDFLPAASHGGQPVRAVRLRVFGPGAAIEIGEGAQLSGTSVTARSQRISIGRQVLLAPNCVIVVRISTPPGRPRPAPRNRAWNVTRPVSIGDYVWIGMNCLILKGVSIGEGAMIGAGSVVTRDVPPFCLAAGAPARVLRRLGPEDAMPGSEGRGA